MNVQQSSIPVLIVVGPLLASFVLPVLGWWRRTWAFPLTITALAVSLGASILTAHQVLSTGPVQYFLGGWLPPWGIEFRIEDLAKLITPKTKLIALTHVSNVMGTVVPVKEVAKLAHDNGAKLLVDGAQAVMHMPVDVQDIDCDFYAFTGHKIYGPSGIGVLYGKAELLDAMPPFLGGGDMISTVTIEKSTWAALPSKFEAGTPPIVQAIGLGAAIDYVAGVGLEAIAEHEHDLLNYATQRLSAIEGLRIIGTAPNKTAVLSFTLDCAHPHDISTIIDRAGVCVRAGHHCAQPLMDRMGVTATARASFGMYNTRAEADTLAEALETVRELFG